MKQTIAFLGLEDLGWHIASHLPRTGHEVWVWHQQDDKAYEHENHFDTTAVSIDLALQADFILCCYPERQNLQQLLSIYRARQGSIWIDCCPDMDGDEACAAQVMQHGVDYLKAPICVEGHDQPILHIKVAGDEHIFHMAKPIIHSFADHIEYIGMAEYRYI